MKKILALIMAAFLLVACVGCGTQKADPTEPTTKATEPTTVSADHTPTYIQLSICEEDMSFVGITAYEDSEGKAYVEYTTKDEKKVATLELSALEGIADAIENSQLKDLNDQHVYEDGMASASMYVNFADGSMLAGDFSGTVPQEFLDGYAEVESYIRELLKDVPVYVPRPLIEGEPNPDALREMEAILEASGAEPLDMFVIADVMMDDSFAPVMGLSKTTGITSGLSCSPMMSPMAFSCMIATAENESHVADIADDFAANVQWNRWVCVSASHAMVATKGNQVLCLAANEDLYNQISDAAESTGWTVVKTLTN